MKTKRHKEITWEDSCKNDYKKLPTKDQKIISDIDKLLKKLSEAGRDYWQTYYA